MSIHSFRFALYKIKNLAIPRFPFWMRSNLTKEPPEKYHMNSLIIKEISARATIAHATL